MNGLENSQLPNETGEISSVRVDRVEQIGGRDEGNRS